ncbi:GNAT family N-acetyltransferase [Oceanobacillus halotolerans]|uniref:GNAT family N-acetyltransferase n=1 Tax=Oceanobacillus halotolerans TaxID=2663380 RepID=UPI0013DC1C93|nr:GNAT family N-acetyltransferase [Oceanobacillus halotolerans]
MDFTYTNTVPDKELFFRLYETTGWNENHGFTEDELFQAITNSWYLVAVYDEDELIAFGRIISDGVYQTLIGDLIVHPAYQKKGLGRTVLHMLLDHCKAKGIKWVQLTAAEGKADFYKKYGFQERPAAGPGMEKYL